MAACVVCQAAATVYCQNDKAFLCSTCDVTIHSSNLVAGRHTRVSVCECCSKSAATVFCKNDRAFLCDACDVEVHAGNPLAASHEIVPIDKIGEEQSVQKQHSNGSDMCESHSATTPCCSTNPTATAVRGSTTTTMPARPARASPACSEAVVPVLAPTRVSETQQPEMVLPSSKDSLYKAAWGKDFDGLELDNAWLDRLDVGFDFSDILAQDNDTDEHGLVPNMNASHMANMNSSMEQEAVAEVPSYENPSDSYDDCTVPRHVTNNNLEHAFSLDDDFMPSFKVPFSGPPDSSYLVQAPMASISTMPMQASVPFTAQPQPIMHVTSQQAALNREQRVLRYREKRKNRKFEKTIRYASRKAYAEVRPRIKGRFAKKEEIAAWEAADAAVVPEALPGMMKVEVPSMH